MPRQPVLFVSHGAPTMAIVDSPARRFLAGLGRDLPAPRAILVASAHWETAAPRTSGAAHPETIHDFWGFPKPLYDIRYPAPGAPDVAARAAELLRAAGMDVAVDPGRGFDHGAWIPLSLLRPEADLPATQLSVLASGDARAHYAMGEALAPLRDEGVLILASGSATHNLRELNFAAQSAATPDWAAAFAEWLRASIENGRIDDLLDWTRTAPHARRNHPTDEHFTPIFVALGAAGGAPGRRIHASGEFGALAMDAYRFD